MAEATASSISKPVKTPAPRASAWRDILNTLTIPVLAIFTALIVSGFIIAFTAPTVLTLLPNFWEHPFQLIGAMWDTVITAYAALLQGAFGDWGAILAGFQEWIATGDATDLFRALRDPFESLVAATPYIFTGLAVAVGFKGGLFNIGVEGQLFAGAIASAWVGFNIEGLPWFIHLPLALLAGLLAGAVWAGIAGVLKATRGVNEVINTIMLNYIMFLFTDWLLSESGPMRGSAGAPRTPEIYPSAYLPRVLPDPVRFHWGFFLAVGAVFFVYWFLWKTTVGFEIRTVGASPTAAKYAGIAVGRIFVLTMGLSGSLAGLAGANELLGLNHYMVAAFSPGYGFDAIALALLGKSNPFGVLASALLFGALRNGATRMQSLASVPVDIISVMQALIIAFIAAPEIVRWIYRLRVPTQKEQEVFARGWGG
ncbi:MAG: ABC transporter permease [Chloroflexi bacterium]|nr:ABC transporter permease [Chloroflexota bacterium]